WDDLFYYCAGPVDALGYNENVIGEVVEDCAKPVVTTDQMFFPARASVTCAAGREPWVRADSRNTVVVEGEMPPRFETLATATVPSLYAAQALRDALEHAGIAVRGTTRVNTTP